MKNECSIVRDLLPLYAEGMLSEDSAAFVKEHLDTCEECCALSAGEEPSAPTDADTEQRTGEAGVLRTLKKKLRKQTWCAIVITVAVVLLVTLLLRLNPIDYLADISADERNTPSATAWRCCSRAGLFRPGHEAEAVLSNVHIVFEIFRGGNIQQCSGDADGMRLPMPFGALVTLLRPGDGRRQNV